MRERPENFVLNNASPLARGLVFAGLGRSPGSVRYKDSSLHGNDGELTNMTPSDDWVWIPELGRWSCAFAAGADQYVSIANDPQFTMGTTGTVSCWAKVTGGDAYSAVVIKGNKTNSIASDSTFYIASQIGKIRGGITDEDINTSTSWSGDWQHVALHWDSTTVTLYVDGCVLDTNAQAGSPTEYDRPIWIGARDTVTFNEETITGNVSDVLIHSRALTLPEIQILADRSDPMLGGLVKPPKRKYYGIPYIRPGYRYKLGRLLLQRT